MIKFHTFTTSAAYNQDLYAFLKTPGMEGLDLNPYLDSVNLPTIGVGFNLTDAAVMQTVATELLGTHLTTTLLGLLNAKAVVYPNHSATSVALLQANLNGVLQNWHNTHDAGTPTQFVFANETQTLNVLNNIRMTYENRVNSRITSVPESTEREVLVSLAYTSLKTVGDKLVAAINTDNRAEAWYEIRYQSNGDHTHENRRYYEASKFGLYYDKTHVLQPEAEQVAQMYTAHRLDVGTTLGILGYEKTYSIAVTNTKLPHFGIQDIYHELQPAIKALKTAYGIASTVNLEEVQIASSTKPNLNGDGTTYDSTANNDDLLIGNNSANVLDGGTGNDALVGQEGDDQLKGNDGNDTLIGGIGIDELIGGKDDDTYVVDGSADKVTELAGEGTDTVKLANNFVTKANFQNVENLIINPAVTVPVTITANQLVDLTFSKNADDITLNFTQSPTDPIVIKTGAGADTVHIMFASVLNYDSLQFTDITSADKIDLRSFNIAKVVDISSFDSSINGNYLIHNSATATWLVDYVLDYSDTVPIKFIGTNITADNFVLA